MRKLKVKKTAVPAGTQIEHYLPANYADTFSCEVETNSPLTAEQIQLAFWTEKPTWVDRLFTLRNKLVKPFGLKGGEKEEELSKLKEAITTGQSIDMISFPVRTDKEVIICLDDKHLTAYLSMIVKPLTENKQQVYAVTVVHFNNRLGYFYFGVIAPFHRLIVSTMLKYTLRKLTR